MRAVPLNAVQRNIVKKLSNFFEPNNPMPPQNVVLPTQNATLPRYVRVTDLWTKTQKETVAKHEAEIQEGYKKLSAY